jgi:hypothetical protein
VYAFTRKGALKQMPVKAKHTFKSAFDELFAGIHPGDREKWAGKGLAKRRRYYKLKYKIAKISNPGSVCEIGVRAGYSAFMFLSACPNAFYYGIDADNGSHGGVRGHWKHAKNKLLSKFDNVKIVVQDSQKLTELPQKFDMIHVDGCHSFAGCLHDLNLACRFTDVIVVDDIHYLKDVRRACNEFIKIHPELSVEEVDDGLRGTCILRRTTTRGSRKTP